MIAGYKEDKQMPQTTQPVFGPRSEAHISWM